jgi:hypothetical protein
MENCTIHYYGRVHPERVGAELRLPPIKLVGKIEGDVFVTVIASQVTASINIIKTTLRDDELRFHVEDILAGIVNILGFSRGCAYDFELVGQIVDSGHFHQVFGVNHPEFADNEKLLGLLIQAASHSRSFFLFRSLKDIREATRAFHDTSFYCYRAIESMTQFFRYPQDGSKLTKEDAWEIMRSNLKVTRDEIDWIRKKADFTRHGEPDELSIEDRDRMISSSVALLNKFVSHLAESVVEPHA